MTLEEILDRVFYCPSGCWLWIGGDTGSGRGGGYGKVWHEGRMQTVSRIVYEKLVGPIPPGWHLDHCCTRWSPLPWVNRRCCRPDHLDPVPGDVNNRRRFMCRA
jgi:hypothetical protein